jgi:hypothetical protein
MRRRWTEHVMHMGHAKILLRIFIGKPEGKMILGRARRRRDDYIQMDLREIGWG